MCRLDMVSGKLLLLDKNSRRGKEWELSLQNWDNSFLQYKSCKSLAKLDHSMFLVHMEFL